MNMPNVTLATSSPKSEEPRDAALRNVYLEPLWKLPAVTRFLISNPPEGYRFSAERGGLVVASERAARLDLSYRFYNAAGRVLPLNLGRAWLGRFSKPPGDTSLTWAVMHPVFRKEPWVLELIYEQPFLLVGRESQFRRFKKALVRLLEADNCRRIVCCDSIVAEALLYQLGARQLERKIEVVERAVPSQEFTKLYREDKVSLLFVNSVNLRHKNHFFVKGGPILLEAFSRLSQRYPHVELVIRSALPPEFKARCEGMERVTLLEDPLPAEEFGRLWQSADIFVLPSHVTPDTALIEAMSYELPVVTTNVWANPNIVQDGKTGMLIDDPVMKRFTDGPTVHLGALGIREAIRRVHAGMAGQLEERLSLLIEDTQLRRRMGKAGRDEVERGRFSLAQRNENLKRVLDDAYS